MTSAQFERAYQKYVRYLSQAEKILKNLLMDFTIKIYKVLLKTLIDQGFSFMTFANFLENPDLNCIILRHDVDIRPENSLAFARIQADLGIKGTYYFRIVPESWDETIIKEVSEMGHEIGYHYEDMSLVAKKFDSNISLYKKNDDLTQFLASLAFESFTKNLKKFREIVRVHTICMHGSPLSRWDNRLIWNYFDYHDLGIIGEPYFDINFFEVMYLTDTGRKWDGAAVNFRDKVFKNGIHLKDSSLKFHSTHDIIHSIKEGRFPEKIMMTFHPQRWNDDTLLWLKEFIYQNIKNKGKYFIINLNRRYNFI